MPAMPATARVNVPITPPVFQDHYGRIRRYIHGLARHPAEADDLTQETFLRAHEYRDSLRDDRALTIWLYRIATRVYLDRWRQRARRSPLECDADPDSADLPDPDVPSPQQTAERHEMSACVQRYVADLPESYRMVMLLHDEHGLTSREITEALGISLATVKIRLHRGRHRLRAALESGCAFSHDERDVLVCEAKA